MLPEQNCSGNYRFIPLCFILTNAAASDVGLQLVYIRSYIFSLISTRFRFEFSQVASTVFRYHENLMLFLN